VMSVTLPFVSSLSIILPISGIVHSPFAAGF
jgi:hypothetical protein